MVGMFWGGLVMALPPVVIGATICVLLLRYSRQMKERERREEAGD